MVGEDMRKAPKTTELLNLGNDEACYIDASPARTEIMQVCRQDCRSHGAESAHHKRLDSESPAESLQAEERALEHQVSEVSRVVESYSYSLRSQNLDNLLNSGYSRRSYRLDSEG